MNYYPSIRTTSAELKAINNCSKLKESPNVIPIVQLTKARLSRTDSTKALDNHIERIFNNFGKDKAVIFTVTDDETFQDANIHEFINDHTDGYVLWRNRLNEIKENYNSNIIPCVVGIGQASQHTLEDLKKQISFLARDFKKIAIILPMNLTDDISMFHEAYKLLNLQSVEEKLNVIIDFKYIPPSDQNYFQGKLKNLSESFKKNKYSFNAISLFSSCPPTFDVISKNNFNLEEKSMIEYSIAKHIKQYKNLNYGDYCYIHPQRLEGGGFWYPRVDYPSINNTCYYMRMFNKSPYRDDNGKLKIETTTPNNEAYIAISKNITAYKFIQEDTLQSWGRTQLINNAAGSIEGKSPQHYIAIRANIHLERIIQIIDH